MVLQRWAPYAPYEAVRRADSLFDRVWRGFATQPSQTSNNNWSVPIDIQENDDRLVISASLPGLESSAIKVSVDGNVLTIRAEASSGSETSETSETPETPETQEKPGGYLVRERRSGTFSRAIRLPKYVDLDKIESHYDAGVLFVDLQKIPEQTPREIEVKVA